MVESENLAPRARFELATLRLTAECSTIELPGIRQRICFHSNTARKITLHRLLSASESDLVILQIVLPERTHRPIDFQRLRFVAGG